MEKSREDYRNEFINIIRQKVERGEGEDRLIRMKSTITNEEMWLTKKQVLEELEHRTNASQKILDEYIKMVTEIKKPENLFGKYLKDVISEAHNNGEISDKRKEFLEKLTESLADTTEDSIKNIPENNFIKKCYNSPREATA